MGWKTAIGSTAAGAALGAGASAVIGKIGVAACGTAVGVGAGPFVAIGAGIGAIGYGVYKLGQRRKYRDYRQGDHIRK